MTLDTFFKKFDQFADAPDAVAKMRELILDLAIGGSLLDSGGKKEHSNRNWPKQNLGSAATLITKGSTPTSYGHQYEKSGIPFVKVENITDGYISHAAIGQYISEVTHEFLRRSQLESGDILFSIAGTIGKTCVVRSCDVPANTNQALAIIRGVGDSFDVSFLKIQLDSFVANKVKEKARGGAMPNVSLGDLRDLLVVVPPLAEQKRIVAKVDELMALCDRLEAQQQERDEQASALARASLARFAEVPTPANLNLLFHKSYSISPAELRKAILTMAVQGKLVSRIASEGSGSDILHASGVKNCQLDDVPTLPSHWTWAQLGSITTLMNSGWSPACESTPAEKGAWGVLKTTAVQSLQYLEEQNKALPPALKPRPENEVMDGDILFTRAGPMNRVGILCVARPTRKKLMLSDKIVRFHLIDGIDPDFAALAMTSGYPSACIEELKSGMAASQVNISQPKLRSVPIPIPPLAEQRRIVGKVDQLTVLVNQLETQLAAACESAGKLLEAVVGELTNHESQ